MTRQEQIIQVIRAKLAPTFLTVDNESAKHHVPKNAETHFKLTIVSEQFTSLTLVARHRLLNKLLNEEFKQGLHALSLHLFTPREWEAREETTMKTPPCLDGFSS